MHGQSPVPEAQGEERHVVVHAQIQLVALALLHVFPRNDDVSLETASRPSGEVDACPTVAHVQYAELFGTVGIQAHVGLGQMVGRSPHPEAPTQKHEACPHVHELGALADALFEADRGIVPEKLVHEGQPAHVDAPSSESQLHGRSQVGATPQPQVVGGLPHELESVQGTGAGLFVAHQEPEAHFFVQRGTVVGQMEGREGLGKPRPLRAV